MASYSENTDVQKSRPDDLKPLSKEEFATVVRDMRDQSRSWIDSEVGLHHQKFWDYYNEKVDKGAPQGRSQAVMTELRDSVESALVSLYRVFLTQDAPVQFKPDTVEAIDLANQQTEAVNTEFMENNAGFNILSDVLRDGLVADYGVMKVYWDEGTEVTEAEYEGLTQDEYLALQLNPDIEILEMEPEEPIQPPPPGQEPLPPTPATYWCRVRQTKDDGRLKFEAVPNEELLVDRSAAGLDTAMLVGQDGLRHKQDVVNAGIATWKEVERYQESSDSGTMIETRRARSTYQESYISTATGTSTDEAQADKATEYLRVSELYVRIDKDRDGIPELYRCFMLGDHVIPRWEVVDDHPFGAGSPFRRPHAALGFGYGTILKQVQDINTAVLRSTLDSIYEAANPQKVVVENQVKLEDVLQNRFRGTIRARQPGMVEVLKVPSIVQEGLSFLEYMEKLKEGRTGVSRASAGLDPDALQSSAEVGVMATVTAAQAKIETVARTFAETLLVPLFRRAAVLLSRHQTRPVMTNPNGQYLPIDPGDWEQVYKTTVNVGIGRGTQHEKQQMLGAVVQKQETIMTTAGADNPIVTPVQYAQALQDLSKAGGARAPGRYFNPPEQVAQAMQQQQGQQEQDPEMVKAQQEMQLDQQKAQHDMAMDQQKAQQDAQKMQFEMQLKQQETLAKLELQKFEVMQKLQIQAEEAGAGIELDARELQLEAMLEIEKMKMGDPAGQGNIPRNDH
jgi:hypothetical protein